MTAYKKLEKHFESLGHLRRISGVLNWDREVLTPSKSVVFRNQQISELSSVIHEKTKDKKLENLFEASFQEKSEVWEKKNLDKMYNIWKQAQLFEDDFVREFSSSCGESGAAWKEAKDKNDWKSFTPFLEKTLNLTKKKSDILAQAQNKTRYNACLDQFERGMEEESIDKIFDDLKTFLIPEVQKLDVKKETGSKLHFPKDKQEVLFKRLMEVLKFDFNKGRLDVATHPFCSAYQGEARVTTYYKEDDLIQGLFATFHETGHASYELGLPEAWSLQPIGSSLGMAIHESQSLFFEMQVGRNKEFLSCVFPFVEETFKETQKWGWEDFFKEARGSFRSYVRVTADEMSYPLHVILRYEIEKDLMADKIQVSDIPELWDVKMKEYLNLSTKDQNNKGCLQDPHWAWGCFGYFPMYTLGAICAAQFFDKAEKDNKNLKNDLLKGDLESLFAWLKENIWQKASFHKAQDLMKEVTGNQINTNSFKTHIKNRYLSS